jgi:peroxiredoxin Q/BCP
MLTVGDNAPDFELVSDEDQTVKLSDFRGQQVVLFFYPKADTPGCTTQACGFRDNFEVIEAANTAVLGISPDSPQTLAKWKKKQNQPYPQLSDPEHEVADAYGVWGEKKIYGRANMGINSSHIVIDADGKIADAQFKVSPKDSVTRAVKFIS